MLWKQRKQKQGIEKQVQIWEEKYSELMRTTSVNVGENKQHSPYQLFGWGPNEIDDQSYPPVRIESSRPREIDGAQIYEIANRVRQT